MTQSGVHSRKRRGVAFASITGTATRTPRALSASIAGTGSISSRIGR
jgi:hypothetical protein